MASKLLVTVLDPEAPLLLYVVASDQWSQWSICLVERTRVKGHSTAYLLHLKILVRSKAELYRDRKNSIFSVDFFKKFEALFPST